MWGRRRWFTVAIASTIVIAGCSDGADDDDRAAVGPQRSAATTKPAPVASSGGVVDTVDTGAIGSQPADPADPAAGSEQAEWTVLVYVMGDNDLEPFAVDDLDEMAEVEASDRVNIVTLVDRNPGYVVDDDPLGDFTDTELFRVTDDGLEQVADAGELNVGSGDTLAGFIEQGISDHPADRYAVVLWDHGASWPGMGPDETDGDDILDLAEIDAAFDEGLSAVGLDRIDLVGFDACLMSSYEVATTMADHADYMIASAELEPGHGWNYAALQALGAGSDVTPEALGNTLIDGFAEQAAAADTEEDITLSLLDLASMGELDAALHEFAQPLMADPASSAPLLARAGADALGFGSNPDPELDSFQVDLGQLAANLGAADERFADASYGVVDALDRLVLTSRTGGATDGATGLSIYLPPVDDYFNEDYLALDDVPVWPDLLAAHFSSGAAIAESDFPSFVDPASGSPTDDADYTFDEDGLTISGTFDLGAGDNLVDAEVLYGVLDEADDSIVFMGEEPAEISTDGPGTVTAFYDLTTLTISDGIDTDQAYLNLTIDEDDELMTFDVPLWYVPPGSIGTDDEPQDVVLSLVLDFDGNVQSETYYRINPGGTMGELTADPDGLIYPVVLNQYPDGSEEWLSLNEEGLLADLAELQYELVPLESGTSLYAELIVSDHGGNTDAVSMFDVIP